MGGASVLHYTPSVSLNFARLISELFITYNIDKCLFYVKFIRPNIIMSDIAGFIFISILIQ